MAKIKLGDYVKDKITDLEGTAMAKTEYLNGCIQFAVQPKKLVEGKVVEEAWIDETQLEIVKKEKPKEKKTKRQYGGVRSHPKIR
jgi:hypothetical protein